jgi:hypothetical protein
VALVRLKCTVIGRKNSKLRYNLREKMKPLGNFSHKKTKVKRNLNIFPEIIVIKYVSPRTFAFTIIFSKGADLW